jgi:hypothetical protein
MTTTRLLLAGLLGGLAMFCWSAIAHMALPLGEAGVAEIPDEAAVVGAMQANIGNKPGFYIFPGAGVGPSGSKHEREQAMKKMSAEYPKNSSGILVYHPRGRPFTFGKWLGIEFVAEVIEAIIAVFLLAQTRLATYAARVGFITVAGLLAAFTTNISYWNWYGFPTDYTLAYAFTQLVGFLCAGLVAALVLKNVPVRTA